MRTDITRINENSPYTDLTEGLQLFAGQCLLCAPVCPDSSIPVKNGKRLDFDYDHCKGCGICAKACPFGAITMKEGIEA